MKREEISEIREDYERFDLDKLIEFLQYGKKNGVTHVLIKYEEGLMCSFEFQPKQEGTQQEVK